MAAIPSGGCQEWVESRIVGVSTWVSEIRRTVTRIAPFDSSILITGPTGSGKGLIAQAIHDASPARDAHLLLSTVRRSAMASPPANFSATIAELSQERRHRS